jgi:hypothetical protein
VKELFHVITRIQPSTLRVHATLVAALATAGCASDTTSPRDPLLIHVASSSRVAQVAPPRSAVAVAPAVSVERDGVPQVNVRVNFVVTLGGGQVADAIATTDTNGVASAGEWTLGAEGANEVLASIDGGPSLAFGGYAFNLPTGVDAADAYDLISENGQSLPADASFPYRDGSDSYKVVAERLILGAGSSYSAVIVLYNTLLQAFTLQRFAGAYSREGAALALAGYGGWDSATGAFQIGDLLAIHASDDLYDVGDVVDDLYRHVGQ